MRAPSAGSGARSGAARLYWSRIWASTCSAGVRTPDEPAMNARTPGGDTSHYPCRDEAAFAAHLESVVTQGVPPTSGDRRRRSTDATPRSWRYAPVSLHPDPARAIAGAKCRPGSSRPLCRVRHHRPEQFDYLASSISTRIPSLFRALMQRMEGSALERAVDS